jgi:hypothetical protein
MHDAVLEHLYELVVFRLCRRIAAHDALDKIDEFRTAQISRAHRPNRGR